MTGASSQAWEYRAGKLQAGRISVTWRYHYPGHQVLEAWQDRRRTGFTVQWFVKDKEGRKVEVKGTIANEELWKSNIDIRSKNYENHKIFVAFVNMAQQALDKQMKTSDLIERANSYERQSSNTQCKKGQRLMKSKDSYTHEFSKDFIGSNNFSYDETKYENISEEALESEFEAYSYVLYCPQHRIEAVALVNFIFNVLDNHNPRTLLQAVINTLRFKMNDENKAGLDQFYTTMSEVLQIKLGTILHKKLSKTDKSKI